MTARRRLVLSAFLLPLVGACSESGPKGPGEPSGVVRSIRFVQDTFALRQSGSATIRAVAYDSAGNEVDVDITYAVRGNTATVNQSGQVSAVKPGVGRLVASADGVSDSTTLEVFGHPEGVVKGSTPLDSRPFGVSVSISGKVYVTRLDAAKVTTLDTALAAGTSVNVQSTPTGVHFSPDGQTAYVTNQLSQTLGVIDVASGLQTDSIELAADPFVVFVSPDGERIFVTTNTSRVYIIDRASAGIVDSVELTHAPNGFALHPDQERVYVSTFVGGTVTEIDIATGDTLRTFSPGGTPQEVVVSSDGAELYVANESGFVEIYDLASGTSVKKVTLAGGGFGAALSPDLEHLYVSEPGAGLVEVVNLTTREIVHTINVGGTPRRIAFTRHGNIAVIPNEAGYVSFVR